MLSCITCGLASLTIVCTRARAGSKLAVERPLPLQIIGDGDKPQKHRGPDPARMWETVTCRSTAAKLKPGKLEPTPMAVASISTCATAVQGSGPSLHSTGRQARRDGVCQARRQDGQLGLSEARDQARAYRLAVLAAEIVQSKKRLEPWFCSDLDIRIFRVSWRHRHRTNQRGQCDNGNTTREHKFCYVGFRQAELYFAQSQFRRTRALADGNHCIAFDLNRSTTIVGLRRGRRLSQAGGWRSTKAAERWNRGVKRQRKP